VLFADLAQSVQLMHADEDGVIDRWLQFIERVQHQLLPGRGGRLVKSHGDALLLEFGDTYSAVQCAFDLHRCMQDLESSPGAGAAMHLRVAVHFAEVVVQALDVYGTGVNLAARLAALAEPGEVVVSTEVRDLLSDHTEWHLHDMGECFLKHFDQPVRAYRVCAGAAPQTPGLDLLDHRPALAIVPFTPRSDQDGPDALGDAICDDLIASLSRHRAMRVIARLSTAALRGLPAAPGSLGKLLAVTYVLSGSYRRRGATVEVLVQLAETRGSTVLWAEQLRSRVDDLFHGQDTLVPAIAEQVGKQILRCEVVRARALPIDTLDDYSLYVGSIAMLHRLNRSDFAQARILLEHLVQRHPRSAAPHSMLAKWFVLELSQGWAVNRARSGQEASEHARLARARDPDQALALAMQAAALAHVGGDLREAQALAEQATEADPQEPHAWLTLGAVHSWCGDAELAERLPHRAVGLSPLDPSRFLFDVFIAAGKLGVGKFADAAAAARNSIRLNAMHTPAHRLLTIALALDGDLDSARASAARLLQLDPEFRVSAYATSYAGRDRPHAAQRMQALLMAGVPA
jgi:adenylate cyclase